MEALLKIFDLTPSDGMMIPVGAVLFVIFWQCLSRALFTPFMQLMDAREKMTTGALDMLKDLAERASAVEQQVLAKESEVRVAAMKQKNAAIEEARKKAQQMIDAADAAGHGLVVSARESIATNIGLWRTNSLAQANGMAEDLVRQVDNALLS